MNNLVIQAVLKSDSIACISGIVQWATAIGERVSVSAYTAAKNGNVAHSVETDRQDALRRFAREVLRLKNSGAPIPSSTY